MELAIPALRLIFLIGAISAFLTGQVFAQDDPDADREQEEPASEARIDYAVQITGVNGDLADLLARLSVLKSQQDEAPPSYGALRSRLEADLSSFERALRSRGYYDGSITHRVDRSTEPIEIVIRVFPGPQFTISEISLQFRDSPPPEEVLQQLRDRMAIKTGDPARADDIVAAEDRIMNRLPQLGYPLAVKNERTVVINHNRNTARITYRFDTGPRLRFGETRYRGGEDIQRGYLQRLTPWEPGQMFDQRLVDRFRRELVATRLFSSVRLGFERSPSQLRAQEGDTRADMEIELSAADLRTISVGAGFSTTEGLGGEVAWEHRNFFGSQERLRIVATGAQIEQSLRGEFRKPNFRRLDQLLTSELALTREDTDAFESLEILGSAGLERVLSNDRPEVFLLGRDATRDLTISIGAEVVLTRVDDEQGERDFFLAGLPLGAAYDTRDSLLDPTEGLRVRVSTAPFLGVEQEVFDFVKNEIGLSGYYPVDEDKDIVLAARATAGSIVGAERETLPANRLFFAGGGGSVRGFGFQDIGPLDGNNDPLGGRSLTEVSFEARFKITDSIGIVPFLDGGQVYDEVIPQLSDFRWGAGLGLRYFTGFAPIRLDVGTPLNPRPRDDRVQFYVSIGQSF